MDSEQLLRITSVAKLMDTTPRTLRRWVSEGRFPQPLTVAGVKRWRAADVQRFIDDAWIESARQKNYRGQTRPNAAKQGHDLQRRLKPAESELSLVSVGEKFFFEE